MSSNDRKKQAKEKRRNIERRALAAIDHGLYHLPYSTNGTRSDYALQVIAAAYALAVVKNQAQVPPLPDLSDLPSTEGDEPVRY